VFRRVVHSSPDGPLVHRIVRRRPFVPSGGDAADMTSATFTPPLLPASARPGRRGLLVCCAGACGGAGASVFAATLARTVVETGRRCLLVDDDPLGAGVDLLLGAEDAPGMRWPDLRLARGRLPAGLLVSGLPAVDGIAMLSWDREPRVGGAGVDALAAVLESGLDEYDVVVLDRGRGAATDLTPVAGLVDLGLVVVPAQVRAAAAVMRAVDAVLPAVRDVRLVVRGPAPTGLAVAAITSAHGLPLAAWMDPEPGLAKALDRGEPPGLHRRRPLRRAAATVLDDLLARADAGTAR
jgi:secretion/DNA translocation related CpaE-like protein